MTETTTDRSRGDGPPEWEVFVREDADDPLRHAGSVSAPTADAARERAATLFGWAASATWLCPADAVVRESTRTLGARYRDGDDEGSDAGRPTTEGADGSRSDGTDDRGVSDP
jgi:rSAM-partnered protein